MQLAREALKLVAQHDGGIGSLSEHDLDLSPWPSRHHLDSKPHTTWRPAASSSALLHASSSSSPMLLVQACARLLCLYRHALVSSACRGMRSTPLLVEACVGLLLCHLPLYTYLLANRVCVCVCVCVCVYWLGSGRRLPAPIRMRMPSSASAHACRSFTCYASRCLHDACRCLKVSRRSFAPSHTMLYSRERSYGFS